MLGYFLYIGAKETTFPVHWSAGDYISRKLERRRLHFPYIGVQETTFPVHRSERRRHFRYIGAQETTFPVHRSASRVSNVIIQLSTQTCDKCLNFRLKWRRRVISTNSVLSQVFFLMLKEEEEEVFKVRGLFRNLSGVLIFFQGGAQHL